MSDVTATLLFGASFWVGKALGPEIAMVFWMLGILIFFVFFQKYLIKKYKIINKSIDK